VPAAEGGAEATDLRDDAEDPAGMRSAMPMLDDATRSPDPNVCPFFRREVDGKLFAPLPEADENNRCAAVGAPRPQSTRQQQLVCLRTAHADCPRYLRGAIALAESPARRTATVPRATLAALLVLVLSAGISFGFVLQRGGIDLPAAATTPSPSAVAIVTTPTPEATPSETPAVTPSALPSPSPSPSPTPEPTLAPTPGPTATPSAKPTPKPTSGRYALLKPCPDRSNCYIYTVRSGDNLYSIARFFGIKLSTILAWNPKYANGARLRAGDQIRMPPPPR